jgi:hypothetical protein
VGGVLPSHVVFSLPHSATWQDWTWATGAHPFAATSASNAAHFSQLQVDTLHRSYLLTSLDVSILAVNEGVQALAGETTTGESFERFRSLSLGALLDEYKVRLTLVAVN